MTKVKRARHKFHAAAQNKKEESAEQSGDVEVTENTDGTAKMVLYIAYYIMYN